MLAKRPPKKGDLWRLSAPNGNAWMGIALGDGIQYEYDDGYYTEIILIYKKQHSSYTYQLQDIDSWIINISLKDWELLGEL